MSSVLCVYRFLNSEFNQQHIQSIQDKKKTELLLNLVIVTIMPLFPKQYMWQYYHCQNVVSNIEMI